MSKSVRPDTNPACVLPVAAERSVGNLPGRARRSRISSAIHRILASQRARQSAHPAQPAADAPATKAATSAAPVEWALRLMS